MTPVKVFVLANGTRTEYIFDSPMTAAGLVASPAFNRQFGVGVSHRIRVNGDLGQEHCDLVENDELEFEARAGEKGA